MRTIILTLSISIISLSCGNKTNVSSDEESKQSVSTNEISSSPESSSTIKKYGIKSGIVTYEIDMMDMTEKMILYFDDYGMKEVEEEYDGEHIKKLTLCDGKDMYNIIPEDKAAYASGSCYRGIAYRFDWNEISEEDQNTRAKKIPNMTVAGKDCEAFSYDMDATSTIYAGWNYICLYQKTKTQSMEVVKKAIDIKENAEIPATKFQVPAGFEIKKSGF